MTKILRTVGVSAAFAVASFMSGHAGAMPIGGAGKVAALVRSRRSVRAFRALTLAMAAGCAAALLLPASFDGAGARAQHRQPRVSDVPSESPQQTTRSPEDIALERALNNICRGCSPIIQVRDVPRYDVARTCPAGDGTESCRRDEEKAQQALKDQWSTFTAKARSDCVQTNEIGGRPSYVQLNICLKTTQVAPTLPEGR